MYIGVACADDDAVVAIEQQITVETVGPGLDDEEETEQRRAVSNCCRRHRSAMTVVFDVAVHPVDRSGEKRAQNEREQHPVLDENIDGQRETLESDLLAVERIFRAKWHLIKKLEQDAPVAGLRRGDQQSEQTRTACDNPGPRQPLA